MKNAKRVIAIALLSVTTLSAGLLNAHVKAKSIGAVSEGGGFSVTEQISNAGYSAKIYDAANGLPTSDANCVLSTDKGYIWVGGYSGVMRYDGNRFTKLSTEKGLTSGRGMFQDSKGRIWVGTNDNGVVVIDREKRTQLDYKSGIPSSSIRVFAEDNMGDVYIGTTAGVCFCDSDLKVHNIDNRLIKSDRVLRLDVDTKGRIYGQTKNGYIFKIEDRKITEAYSSNDIGLEQITTIMADKKRPGYIYLGTDGDVVYHGQFGNHIDKLDGISIAPLKGPKWIAFECGRVWVASISGLGYVKEDKKFVVLNDIPIKSGIEMLTSDYQGNIWLASSTQGVMKIVRNNFTDLTNKAGLESEVVDSACYLDGLVYIGTEKGLRIIDEDNNSVTNELTELIGDSRVRCIKKGNAGDLWIGTYTNGKGLIHYQKNGIIKSFTRESNGLINNEVRSISVCKNGDVVAGTNGGLCIINEDRVIRSIGAENLKNTSILTVEELSDGTIYAGSDGDGIYVINDDGIKRLGRDDGLTSDVIMRIKKDTKLNVIWIVTSNSIQFIKNGTIREVKSFPYNNNYDIYFAHDDKMWVISSYGVYSIPKKDMLKDKVKEYDLYTINNGLTGAPTSLGYCGQDSLGNLYIPTRSGLSKVNIDHFSRGKTDTKVDISSITVDNKKIFSDKNGKYVIPANSGRLVITPAVLDYTMINPTVEVYLSGRESEGLITARSELKPLEYTGLKYGKYTLHIRLIDANDKITILDKKFKIEKKPMLFEIPLVRLIIALLIVFLTGYLVWKIMTSTVISRQYEEIRQARDEAERANTAKSRFLANMSHEIRTPINTIMGMNEMCLMEDATDVPKPYFMSIMNYSLDIRNASQSLLSLINDLLDMSKIESGKMHLVEQEYDTVEMVRSIVTMIRSRSTEKELIFDVVVDDIMPTKLYGDSGKIKQVVLNLLTNAVKYTEKGGIGLFVSMDEREDDDCVVRFSVKDTGMGVKPEDMEKLFNAYERFDEEKNSGIQGTGLGLNISKKYSEMMGGTLVCESEYGKGSEFILTLHQKIIDGKPIGVFVEKDASASGPYVPQFIAPDADILVVDDNPMNLNVIKGLLKGTKVLVTTANSGEECLERIKETNFNVVLLDHMMPGMDGLETIAEIRKDYPDLPVYALTANTSVGADFYISKGFDGYLTKPIDSHTLESTIIKHIPESIMAKPEETDVVEELTEIPENLQWIYDVDGILVEEGIKNSGGIMNYIFSLNMFLDTVDANSKVIMDAYKADNVRLYTIKVHALKSSARIIGAMELSKLAEILENAGNKGDMKLIHANNNRLMTMYIGFKDKLERLQENPDSSDKEMISDEELHEAYDALSEMIPQMDYDAVEMILRELMEYQLPKDDEVKVKELARMLKVFDWDGMEELIGGIDNG